MFETCACRLIGMVFVFVGVCVFCLCLKVVFEVCVCPMLVVIFVFVVLCLFARLCLFLLVLRFVIKI